MLADARHRRGTATPGGAGPAGCHAGPPGRPVAAAEQQRRRDRRRRTSSRTSRRRRGRRAATGRRRRTARWRRSRTSGANSRAVPRSRSSVGGCDAAGRRHRHDRRPDPGEPLGERGQVSRTASSRPGRHLAAGQRVRRALLELGLPGDQVDAARGASHRRGPAATADKDGARRTVRAAAGAGRSPTPGASAPRRRGAVELDRPGVAPPRPGRRAPGRRGQHRHPLHGHRVQGLTPRHGPPPRPGPPGTRRTARRPRAPHARARRPPPSAPRHPAPRPARRAGCG